MRKLLALLLTLASGSPAFAQSIVTDHYEYSCREKARFYFKTVTTMGRGTPAIMPQSLLVGGKIFSLIAPVSSATGGATVAGVAIPPNTLIGTGRRLHVKVMGTTAANGNTKQVNLVFGSTTVALLNAAANNKDFYADVEIYRTGLSAQQICVAGYANNALLTGLGTTSTQTETAAINVQVSLPASTGAADVVLTQLLIEGES